MNLTSCEYFGGYTGRVLSTSKDVLLLGARLKGNPTLVVALQEVVSVDGYLDLTTLALFSSSVHFDFVVDYDSHFGSFGKATLVWSNLKPKYTDLVVEWEVYKPKYQAAQENVQTLLDSCHQEIKDFLALSEDQTLHDYSTVDVFERPIVKFYVKLILQRGVGINPLQAHSFLQKNVDVRNRIKESGYLLSNMTPFFQKHFTYFAVNTDLVTLQPYLFLKVKEKPIQVVAPVADCVNEAQADDHSDNGEYDLLRSKIKCNLRSVLLSSKGWISLSNLEGEYYSLVGSSLTIAVTDLGYYSLENMLEDMLDVVQITRSSCGEVVVNAVADSSTTHIASLVSRQKSTKSTLKIQKPHIDCSEAVDDQWNSAAISTSEADEIESNDRKAAQVYQYILWSRPQGVRVTDCHSFLLKHPTIRQHLSSTYTFSNLKDFFQKYPNIFYFSGNNVCLSEKLLSSVKISKNNYDEKACLKLEKKAIMFFVATICKNMKDIKYCLTVDNAHSTFVEEAPLDVVQYIVATYGEDLRPFFERYQKCFHITKNAGKLFIKKFKKINEFFRGGDFAAQMADMATDLSSAGSSTAIEKPRPLSNPTSVDSGRSSPLITPVSLPEQTVSVPSCSYREIACQTVSTGPILSMGVYTE